MNLNLAFNAAAEYYSVFKRIESLLLLSEIPKGEELEKNENSFQVVVQNISSSWDDNTII